MLIREDKLRKLIRESLLDDAQDYISSSVDDAQDFVKSAYEKSKGAIDDAVALAKLHPTAGLVLDFGELSADLYDIMKDAPNVGNVKNMTKEELKKARREHADKVINLIGDKLADFVVEKMVLGQIDKIDAVLELTFDTNTKELVKVAFSEEFRKSMIAIFGEFFTQLGAIPGHIMNDIEETIARVYTNTVNSFKTSDKDKYANITKMVSRQQTGKSIVGK